MVAANEVCTPTSTLTQVHLLSFAVEFIFFPLFTSLLQILYLLPSGPDAAIKQRNSFVR